MASSEVEVDRRRPAAEVERTARSRRGPSRPSRSFGREHERLEQPRRPCRCGRPTSARPTRREPVRASRSRDRPSGSTPSRARAARRSLHQVEPVAAFRELDRLACDLGRTAKSAAAALEQRELAEELSAIWSSGARSRGRAPPGGRARRRRGHRPRPQRCRGCSAIARWARERSATAKRPPGASRSSAATPPHARSRRRAARTSSRTSGSAPRAARAARTAARAATALRARRAAPPRRSPLRMYRADADREPGCSSIAASGNAEQRLADRGVAENTTMCQSAVNSSARSQSSPASAAERRQRIAVRPVPARAALVKRRDLARPHAPDLGAQEVAKEGVVSVDAAALVVARDEEVLRLELGEDPAGAGVARQLREVVRQRVGDARAQEELAAPVDCARGSRAGGSRRPLVAGEALDERPGIRLALERDRGEAQPGRPALRPPVQDVDLVEAEAGSFEQLGALLSREREVSRTDLRQPPLSRRRWSPRCGSARVETTNRIEHGACESRFSSSRRTMGLSSSWTSSSTRTTGVDRSPSRSNEPTTGSSAPIRRQRADPLERELHPEPELWAPVVVPVDVSHATSSRPAPTLRAAPSFPSRRAPRRASRTLDAARHELEQPLSLDVALRQRRGRQLRGQNGLRRSSVFRITTARGLGARHWGPPFRWLEAQGSPKGEVKRVRRSANPCPGQLLDSAYEPVITQLG